MPRSKRTYGLATSPSAVRILIQILLCALVILLPFDALSPPAKAGGIPLGFYVGQANPSGIASVGAATGTSPTLASDYLVGSAGWDGLIDPKDNTRLLGAWEKSDYRLVLGVPIIPTSKGAPVGTLALGATGAYNPFFTALAEELISAHESHAILRLGWEFNGNWNTWSVTSTLDAANFAAFWRQIVTTMRSVPGADFQYVWNVSSGSSTPGLLAASYPGNAYVDDVGVDVYDESCAAVLSPEEAWSNQLTTVAGLDWAASFATSHHKRVAIPEWGLDDMTNSSCSGLGDDPYFIDQMADWVVAHHAAFDSYFDVNVSDGSHDLEDALFPNSLAVFRQDF
jgi:hypothetical protein